MKKGYILVASLSIILIAVGVIELSKDYDNNVVDNVDSINQSYLNPSIASNATSNFCDGAKKQKISELFKDVKITNFGNGVYYFSLPDANVMVYYEKVFAKSLSSFLSRHPDLELVSMAGEGLGHHGANTGYTVYFKNKHKESF